MTVFGVCMVRNAGDIVGPVVRHMLTEVDAVIVADNLSDDDTREQLDDIAAQDDRLTVVDDLDPAHRQGAKTTALADQARQLGADWIVPFDSDEAWYSPFGRVADILDELPSHIFIAEATLYDHVATGADFEHETNPLLRIGWRRRAPGPFPKVAVRAAPDLLIGEGNHDARYGPPGFEPAARVPGRLIIRHFPYRSPEQMTEKARIGAAALRAAPELGDDIGRHWRDYDALGYAGVREAFFAHFHVAAPERDPSLVYDPAPLR